MASSHHDDDTLPEQTEGYKLSQPKQSLAQYQQMGKLTSASVHRLLAGFAVPLSSHPSPNPRRLLARHSVHRRALLPRPVNFAHSGLAFPQTTFAPSLRRQAQDAPLFLTATSHIS